jgi:HK97 family phage major capsid protein
MSSVLNSGVFSPEITNEIYSNVKGKSSIAKLTGAKPLAFTGIDIFKLNLDNEAAIVGENQPKANGGATLGTITVKPVKFEYGFRTSDEFNYSDEQYRAGILEEFGNEISKKFARALDISAIHGTNPRTGTASELSTSSFDNAITQIVEAKVDTSGKLVDPYADLQSAIGLIANTDNIANGLVITPGELSAIAGQRSADGTPLFGEIGLATDIDTLKGLSTSVNGTLNTLGGAVGTQVKNDNLALVGDFANAFRWGVAKEIPYHTIPYGDPDNSGYDLAGNNQIYLRAEIYLGWGIFDPTAFAFVKLPEEN